MSAKQQSDVQGEEAGDGINMQPYELQKSEVGGKEAEEELSTLHAFDRNRTHFPVFCLTKPTDEYWDQFIQHAQDIPWTQICYNSPLSRENVVQGIEENLGNEGPWPFIGFTVEDVYEFHKKYTRPADDSTNLEPFTYFTFLVIDDECLNPRDPVHGFSVMVCCDAPDYDDPDGGIVLKRMRVPVETAMGMFKPLEQLTMTPSEAFEPDGTALCSIPPFTVNQVSKPPNEGFKAAAFAQARAFKREGIIHQDVALRPTFAERTMDNERRTQLFKVSLREARAAADLHWEVNIVSKKHGSIIQFRANTSRSEDEENEGLGEPSRLEKTDQDPRMRG